MFAEVSNVPLSVALSEGRRLAGLDLADAATAVGTSAAQLSGFERGLAHPNRRTIIALAGVYGLDAARLGTDEWVPRNEPSLDLDDEILWLEWLPIRYTANGTSNEAILGAVADGIRLLRRLGSIAPVKMRTDEFGLVLSLLDLDDPDLVRLFVQTLRLPWRVVEDVVSEARRRDRTSALLSRVRRLEEIKGGRSRIGVGDL